MIKLNSDQQQLLTKLKAFVANSKQHTFLLSGQAGVGKTTCVKFFVRELLSRDPLAKICIGAPTNHATTVIKDAVNIEGVTYKTIYSLLGLRMTANGAVKELTDSGSDNVKNYDMVIVDEGSMINTILIEHIRQKITKSKTKLVIIGDKEQLPPVNEESSPIWTEFPVDYELTEVMRHQNSILDFVQQIRGNSAPSFVSTGDNVIIASGEQFMDEILKSAIAGEFHKGAAKALAWRNITVDALNQYIRDNNPLTASPDKFVAGDRIIVKEPILLGEQVVASIDDEGVVLTVQKVPHKKHPLLKVWQLSIKLENGFIINATLIHEESADKLQNMLDELKASTKWRKFWKLKEDFHSVSYAYALTVHKSQGSTFKKVFLAAGDVMKNRQVPERTQCLYVGASRASEELWVCP